MSVRVQSRFAFAAFGVFAILLCETRLNSQTNTHLVSFAITDCWGNPIRQVSIQLNALSSQGRKVAVQYPAATSVRLQPGIYQVLTEAPGFLSSATTFQLGNTDMEVRNCLTLAPIEGGGFPEVSIRGTSTPPFDTKGETWWARLVGLYSDANRAAFVDAQGRFLFNGIQPGRYLMLLLDATGIRSQKQIDVRGPVTTVALP
jgi:hypothetical protein